jgi:predicted MPP superfamily phosphohydrolase
LRAFSITELEPAEKDAPLEGAFANILSNLDAAASQVMRMAAKPASRRAYLAAALRSQVAKAEEVHYYKYLAALMEDSALTKARWQPHLIAVTVYYLKGTKDTEPAAMKRAREALKSLPV